MTAVKKESGNNGKSLRRQFALRLLGEKVNPAYRREVPGEAQRRQPKRPRNAEGGTGIRQAGRKDRQIRLLLLQHVLRIPRLYR